MSTSQRPTWYKPDVSLAARMVLTMLLLGAVYVIFAVILRSVLGLSWLLLAVLALLIAGVQFFFADKIALRSMRARIVDEHEEPRLHEIVARLAAQANLPTPHIALISSSVPNAFATGRSKNHAVVAVTTALRDQLSTPELEAVIAHELTHIINRDMLVMTLATFFSMVAALLVQNVFWLSGSGRRRNNQQAGLALVLLVSLVAYVLSFLLIRALSRYRELAADRGGALITGAPEHLSAALIHIDAIVHGATGEHIPETDFRQAQAVNALCIMPITEGNPLATLLSTHPSFEQRLEQMRRMQRQMEAMPVG